MKGRYTQTDTRTQPFIMRMLNNILILITHGFRLKMEKAKTNVNQPIELLL